VLRSTLKEKKKSSYSRREGEGVYLYEERSGKIESVHYLQVIFSVKEESTSCFLEMGYEINLSF